MSGERPAATAPQCARCPERCVRSQRLGRWLRDRWARVPGNVRARVVNRRRKKTHRFVPSERPNCCLRKPPNPIRSDHARTQHGRPIPHGPRTLTRPVSRIPATATWPLGIGSKRRPFRIGENRRFLSTARGTRCVRLVHQEKPTQRLRVFANDLPGHSARTSSIHTRPDSLGLAVHSRWRRGLQQRTGGGPFCPLRSKSARPPSQWRSGGAAK